MTVPDPDIRPGAIVVCMPAASPANFADDAFSPCARCGTRLRHRPQVPAHARKVCFDCADKLIGASKARGEPVKAVVTPMTVRDLALYYSTGRRQ